MVFSKKKAGIPPAETIRKIETPLPMEDEVDGEVIVPIEPSVPEPEPEQIQVPASKFDEGTVEQLGGYLGVYLNQYTQQFEETMSNLDWIMKDHAAKSAAIKVIMQNLQRHIGDMRTLGAKAAELFEDGEEGNTGNK